MSKLFTLLSFLLLFYSCRHKTVENDKEIEASALKGMRSKEVKTFVILDTLLRSVTDTIDGQRFLLNFYTNYNLYLLNEADTIYKEEGSAFEFEFKDFDLDGYKDVRLYYMTNIPGIEGLLLYDEQQKSFKEVSNFQDVPSPHKILNTKYYYSYHRNGCADMNWCSDLFYIENYKVIKIGSIDGYECGNSGIKDGIYISKILNDKKTEIDRLPIDKINSYKTYKWGFINHYWTKHYKDFSR